MTATLENDSVAGQPPLPPVPPEATMVTLKIYRFNP
jgi:succinate dehydrogenase / fumarate reductase iron-sulfur subunit